MRNVLPRVWLTTRAIVALGVVAAVLACSPAWPSLLDASALLGAALAIAIAIDALGLPSARELEIARVVPEHVRLRRSKQFEYVIDNRSRRALYVSIDETPLRTLDIDDSERVVAVPAQSRAIVPVAFVPIERGSDRFTRIFVKYRTALGLIQRRFQRELSEAIRVYPDLSAVEKYGSLNVRNRLVEAGLRRMRLRGVGTEFESVRDYTGGDAFRAIDWKATARRGKLMVVQREIERSQDVVVLLDCGRLMSARVGDQRKIDYAITTALSLASVAALASDRVGVVAFARDIVFARSPRASANSVRALGDALCDLEPTFEEADYARAVEYARTHLHRRSLVVLLTDVIDAVSQSVVLAQLGSLSRHHRVLCVFMNDAAVTDTLAGPVRGADDAYRVGVAVELESERRAATQLMRRNGMFAIDVPAAKMSVAVIDEYFKIKARGAL